MFGALGTNPRTQGQNEGQNISFFEERYLGNVPECPWEQEQGQGGFAPAPCNPVTLSPNMDEAREREAKNKKQKEKGIKIWYERKKRIQ